MTLRELFLMAMWSMAIIALCAGALGGCKERKTHEEWMLAKKEACEKLGGNPEIVPGNGWFSPTIKCDILWKK